MKRLFRGSTPEQRKGNLQYMCAEFRVDMRHTLDKFAQIDAIRKNGVVQFFGSAKIESGSGLYSSACEVGKAVAGTGHVVVTGGGPGIMEAALEGARQVPDSNAMGVQTHFLAKKEGSANGTERSLVHSMHARKVAMVANSSALIFYPGGFGTLDELTEFLTLMQLGQMPQVPIILMGGKERWQGLLDWLEKGPAAAGMINEKGLALLKDNLYFTDTTAQVLAVLRDNPRPGWLEPEQLANKMADWFEADMKMAFCYLDILNDPLIAFFGSSMVPPKSAYYESARSLAKRVGKSGCRIYSDGTAGIMEAVHLGAQDAEAPSFGFVSTSAGGRKDPAGSRYVPVNLLCSRKLLMGSADVLIFSPGGIGTLDELSEYTVRVQIGDMEKRPIILTHPVFWKGLVEWEKRENLSNGYISQSDLDLWEFAAGEKRVMEQIHQHIGEGRAERNFIKKIFDFIHF